ncbi:MAG: hydroxyacylglutathione hydrolase [Chlamydiia bacterium]|nr:hydroxyacylglutathione hydrolase [Chlamydiia bacterium]
MREKINLGSDQYLYQLKILEDNYVYILTWDKNALVVDPGEGEVVQAFLDEHQLKLENILITHFHSDHTNGIEHLMKKCGCHVIGPDDTRVPHLGQSVADGEELVFGPFEIEVFSTPGHTHPHIVYFFRELHLLFPGDLLFGAGCGRLFEGSPKEMFDSLQKVAALPDDTAIYCGHEYTVKNLEFAHSIEPDNAAVKQRLEKAKKAVTEGKGTVPSTLALEKETNPFLRASNPALQRALQMEGKDPLEIFTHLRSLRDQF